MRKTNISLFLPGVPQKIDFNRVREVLKADHNIIRFVDFLGNTIESNLAYLLVHEAEDTMLVS
jgi:hypothetical protein